MNQPLEYTIHLPEMVEKNALYPVIFALHGIGYNEKDMISVVRSLSEAFIIVGIRGHLAYENGHAYYVLKGYGNPDRQSFDTSIEMLNRFVESISSEYPIDPERRYLAGFSQGAILSLTLALTFAAKWKGVAAMNGYIPGFVKEEYPLQPSQHLSVYLSDGSNDPIFPPHVGAENFRYLEHRAASVRYRTFDAGHEITEENREDLAAWFRKEAKKAKQ